MGVCEYWPDVLFVHQGNVFFRLSEGCVGECSEDIEAGFRFSVDVICVWFGCHCAVVSQSECGGPVGVGYWCVVKCYRGLCVVFAELGCD